MRCPTCGEWLRCATCGEDELVADPPDPIATVVRRLDAELYGPPIHEHHNERPAE